MKQAEHGTKVDHGFERISRGQGGRAPGSRMHVQGRGVEGGQSSWLLYGP